GFHVTGVQTCALPIYARPRSGSEVAGGAARVPRLPARAHESLRRTGARRPSCTGGRPGGRSWRGSYQRPSAIREGGREVPRKGRWEERGVGEGGEGGR